MNYKTTPGKSQLLLTSKEEASITIEDTTIKNSSSKKLLGVLTDNKLTFNDHVSKLCEKVSQKYMPWRGPQTARVKKNYESL